MQERGQSSIQGRHNARVELDSGVAIQFDVAGISGAGQNISAQGVFFTAEAALPVTVRIAGRGEVHGTLVRLESMGNGRIGIAVRFDDDHPKLAE
jgi:hypothetical protein